MSSNQVATPIASAPEGPITSGFGPFLRAAMRSSVVAVDVGERLELTFTETITHAASAGGQFHYVRLQRAFSGATRVFSTVEVESLDIFISPPGAAANLDISVRVVPDEWTQDVPAGRNHRAIWALPYSSQLTFRSVVTVPVPTHAPVSWPPEPVGRSLRAPLPGLSAPSLVFTIIPTGGTDPALSLHIIVKAAVTVSGRGFIHLPA